MILRSTFLLLLSTVLPALAQSSADPIGAHPQCLTPLLVQRELAPEKIDPSLMAVLNELCQGPEEPNGRPVKQRNVLSNAGHFRVHYDTDGQHAVETRDANGNSVPDYIDSVTFYLEYAWDVEITQFGYAPPPSDNRGMGPEVDVYVCALSTQFYGGAQPENDNVLGQNPARVHGYLLLDNDYKGYPTAGIEGLRVTTAHEFHHIVQFSAYRTALAPFSPVSQFVLYESTSTWFEKKVHPDILDYRQYADALLGAPHKYGYSTHATHDGVTGYGHVLYMDYLEKRFGRDVVREIWEEFRLRESFDAIDVTLGSRGRNFNLARSYCEFAEWSYYTGHRAHDTTFLKEAPRLPALRAEQLQALDGVETEFEGELYPLSFALFQLVVPTSNVNVTDTIDFLVTNSRSDLGMGGQSISKEQFRIDISINQRADYLTLPRDDGALYYRLVPLGNSSANSFCLDVIDDSVNTVLGVRTSPQPFINKPGEEILFSVNSAGEQVLRVKMWIYSVGLTRVAEIDQVGLKSRDNQLGVTWDGLDYQKNRVPSGIYIYEMSINDADPILGKIAVVRE